MPNAKTSQRLALFSTFALLVMVACQPAGQEEKIGVSSKPPATAAAELPDASEGESAEAWDTFVHQYIEDFLAAHPAKAVSDGRHEFDGLLPDWSAEGIAREIARLHRAREEALSFGDEQLGELGQDQRDYMLASIDRLLFWLEKAEWPFVNPHFYFDWLLDSLDPSPYITLDYAPLEERMDALTRFAENIPQAVRQIRSNLRMPMARTRLQFGIDSFGGLGDYLLNDVPAVFASVEDDERQAAFTEASTAAAAALKELTQWLESNLDTATEDFALGADLFSQMIYDAERVDIIFSVR
jgi:hypothetical protein